MVRPHQFQQFRFGPFLRRRARWFVRLHEGALQGHHEERRAGVCAYRFDQSLFGEAKPDDLTGEIRPQRPKRGMRGQNGFEILLWRRKNQSSESAQTAALNANALNIN